MPIPVYTQHRISYCRRVLLALSLFFNPHLAIAMDHATPVQTADAAPSVEKKLIHMMTEQEKLENMHGCSSQNPEQEELAPDQVQTLQQDLHAAQKMQKEHAQKIAVAQTLIQQNITQDQLTKKATEKERSLHELALAYNPAVAAPTFVFLHRPAHSLKKFHLKKKISTQNNIG